MKPDSLRIGNQTSCWAGSPTEPFDFALAHAFDAFEWFPDKKPGIGWDDADLTSEVRRHIRQSAQANAVHLSVHARWQANPLLPGTFPLLQRDLDFARDIGALLLNIHLFHEQGLPAFIDAIQPLIFRTADAGMTLSIENTPHHAPELFNELFHRLQESAPSIHHVGMCLDLGHANLCTATHNDYLNFVDRLGPHVPLVHLHLHENWGDADTHLPLFTGPAGRDDRGIRGLLLRLRHRGYRGSIILEQWPHPPSLLEQARVRLQQLWCSLEPQPAPEPSSPQARNLTEASHSAVQPNSGAAELEEPRASHASRNQRVPSPDASFASIIIAGDRQARSWREKLDFAQGLLAQADPPLNSNQLIDLSIYLRFLGSGQLNCTEDGRHFRPAHHAQLAARIREHLAALAHRDNLIIVRRIYPWLPSSAPEFLRPEPLTRIRDIAHRNDIDPELKREIKTTLQNKLHRCAGPEDLATSASLLRRITAPGSGYPADFIEQFSIFHQELQEFFNAQSLTRRLESLQSRLEPSQSDALDRFQRHPSLAGLTDLRAALAQPSGPQAPELVHECQLADIALEDFAFALLSETVNSCEHADTPSQENTLLEGLRLGMENLRLSGIEPEECAVIASELRAWGISFHPEDRDACLRMKATLLRGRRLIEKLCDQTLAHGAGRVDELGRALGVADHAIRMFAEAEVRGHLMFQISRILSLLLRQVRRHLRAAPWDVVVAGCAVGRLRSLGSLDHASIQDHEPVVALLTHAAGDEEIPSPVKALIILRELPHLSHLAVRARQAGVVVVTCEELVACDPLQNAAGQRVSIHATADQFTWRTLDPYEAAQAPVVVPPQRLIALQPAENLGSLAWLPLESIDTKTGGAKANGLRCLHILSRESSAGFKVPPAMVVPFSAMEVAFAAQPEAHEQYQELLRRLDQSPTDDFSQITQRLRELTQTLKVPEAIVRDGLKAFGVEGPLMVRSSANDEDLESGAAAGLYESVLCPRWSDVDEAIRKVWSSLWTVRAAFSRLQSGIGQERARMAVVIQQVIRAALSFVLHTANPITSAADEMCAELAVGLGETLVSAVHRGTPYRLTVHKTSGKVTTLAFANFSEALMLDSKNQPSRLQVDYTQQALSRDARSREALGRRLAAIAQRVERVMGGPQDIEGVLAHGEIYLVQTRPQMGADEIHQR